MSLPLEPPLDFYRVVITDPLITLSMAKDHLRVTDALHDTDISSKILQSQNMILDYLKRGADSTWTVATVPYPVQAAILEMLAHLYEDRAISDLVGLGTMADEKVWASIERKLDRFRDPAMA